LVLAAGSSGGGWILFALAVVVAGLIAVVVLAIRDVTT
jgi:hypothetical protein